MSILGSSDSCHFKCHWSRSRFRANLRFRRNTKDQKHRRLFTQTLPKFNELNVSAAHSLEMSSPYNHLKCSHCQCTESMFWKATGDNQHLCHECSASTKGKQDTDTARKAADDRKTKTRKSTRSTRYNGNKNGNGTSTGTGPAASNGSKTASTKPSGRGRRNLNRRPPIKTPTIPASTRNVDSLFYKVGK